MINVFREYTPIGLIHILIDEYRDYTSKQLPYIFMNQNTLEYFVKKRKEWDVTFKMPDPDDIQYCDGCRIFVDKELKDGEVYLK